MLDVLAAVPLLFLPWFDAGSKYLLLILVLRIVRLVRVRRVIDALFYIQARFLFGFCVMIAAFLFTARRVPRTRAP